MLVDLILIMIGLAGLIYSADKFVDGASSLALNLKMPLILVGLIVVGIGTSAPEILVSTSAALNGSDLALGNAIGSNIANIGLIIGVTALIVPITVRRELLKKEFVLLLGSTGLGMYLLSDGMLTRMDAIVLFLGLIFVMYYLIQTAMNSDKKVLKTKTIDNQEEVNKMSMQKSIGYTLAGIAALVIFSKVLVIGAISLAKAWGVSDVVIGLTIVSIGTSLPELSACIAAARKGNSDLAIGNIVGSNIFNILAVLSVSGFIFPMGVSDDLLYRDIPLMMILTVGFLLVSLSPKGDAKISRFEGVIFLSVFISYLVILVLDSLNKFKITEFLNSIGS